MGNHFRHPAEVPDLRLQGSKMVTGFLKLNSQFGFPLLQVGEPGGELLQLVRQFEVRLQGGDAYARVGTPTSTGTKVFSVVGKIRNTGLVEVPMGTSIREIVYDIGGGPPDGGRIKAVQIGGPSGGCIPMAMLTSVSATVAVPPTRTATRSKNRVIGCSCMA